MKKYSYILSLAALAAVISGCSVGRMYQRPKLDMPDNYAKAPAIVTTGDTTKLPYRSFFKDPALISLIDSALVRNADMQVAVKNLEQANNNLRQAKMGLVPQVNLVTTASRNWPSKTSLNGSFSEQLTGTSYLDDYNASLQFVWEADIWGKVAKEKQAARAGFFGQTATVQAVRTRFIANVAQAYYDLLSLDEQLCIARSNVRLSDSTVQMLTTQFESGLINRLAVEQARAQLKTAQLIVPLTEQNIRIRENALNLLVGRYPAEIARRGALQNAGDNLPFQAGVPVQLLSRRPDVKASEFNLIGSNAQVGIAQAAMYPSFTINYQAGVNSLVAGKWFNIPASFFHTLTGNLTQVLLQKRQLRTAYDNALLEKDKNVVLFRQTVLTAVTEVNDALTRVGKSRERVELARERKAQLDRASSDALTLFNSGMANYLEVITAQNNALQSQLELTTIITELEQANIELYRAMGGGTE